jgi:RNA polymerase sigma-70 factor (ECF subfamily)
MQGESAVPIEALLAQRGWVRALARTLVADPAAADDLEQQAWVEALEHPPAHAGGLRGWFATVLRRRARDGWRERSRRTARETASARPEGTRSTAEVVAEADAQRRLVDSVMGLDEPFRETILLRYFEDLPPREIAARQGVPVETVRSRNRLALERLRERLDRGHGGNRSAWVAAFVPLTTLRWEPAAITGTTLSGSTVTGGAIMASKATVGAVVAAALAGGVVGGAVMRPSTPAPGIPTDFPGGTRPVEVAGVPVADSGPAPGAASVPAGTPPVSSAPASRGAADFEDLQLTEEERRDIPEMVAQYRHRRERMRIDPGLGGVEVLQRAREFGLDPLSLIASYDAVRARVRVDGERRSVDAPADGSPVDLSKWGAGVAILELGPGTFKLDPRSSEWLKVREGSRSLEIRGAGMDRTTIVYDQVGHFAFASDEGRFENLVIRDLTLDGGERGDLIVDARGAVSVALENVRVAGWHGSGHGAAIGVSGNALLGARGCEFIGRGGGLFVLSVRGQSLAVFEKCLFVEPGECVVGNGTSLGTATGVRLIDCTFRNAAVVSRRMLKGSKPLFPVSVTGGGAMIGAPDITEEDRRKAFGAEWLAALEGTTLGPGIPDCTASEIAALLERVVVGASETVYGVRHLGPGRFGLRVLDRTTSGRSWRIVGTDGNDIEKSPRDPGGGWNAPTGALLDGVQLASILRNAPIPPESAATEIGLTGMKSNEADDLGLNVKAGAPGFYDWFVQVSTGKVLSGGPPKK